MFKERFLHFTGFDLFERKYFLFLIPGAIIVPMFLLLRNYSHCAQNKSFFKLFVSMAARFFAYGIPCMILLQLLDHMSIGKIGPILSFVWVYGIQFLISVAWMGLVSDYE